MGKLFFQIKKKFNCSRNVSYNFNEIFCLLHEGSPAKENFCEKMRNIFRKCSFVFRKLYCENSDFCENDDVFREQTKQNMRQFRQHFFISLAY